MSHEVHAHHLFHRIADGLRLLVQALREILLAEKGGTVPTELLTLLGGQPRVVGVCGHGHLARVSDHVDGAEVRGRVEDGLELLGVDAADEREPGKGPPQRSVQFHGVGHARGAAARRRGLPDAVAEGALVPPSGSEDGGDVADLLHEVRAALVVGQEDVAPARHHLRHARELLLLAPVPRLGRGPLLRHRPKHHRLRSPSRPQQ
mmetsp:Transcript_137595/g.427444  ORF Transcript_137595/g.427444 Transcript_137595/m.427444 type:complete len:205 (+) Transcript_137595:413-1027(+)